ncbi:hypothetical protein VXM67_17025 [Pseudomonas sp. Rh2]|uniref:hypothetical protein n=1 Tax=Pseudomonas sp. Rh2 TaxID=3112956 RepID=UPI00345CC833
MKLQKGDGHYLIALSVAVVMVFGVLYAYFHNFSTDVSTKQDVWGQFGDYVGGLLNPTLSFFAFTGLLLTLRMQRIDSEKADRRHVNEEFDSRLFHLLSLLHASIASLKFFGTPPITADGKIYEGHRAIAYAWWALHHRFVGLDREQSTIYEHSKREFKRWRKDFWVGFANYYETVALTIEYIEKSASEKDKKFAFHALRTQLILEERSILFYVFIFSGEDKYYDVLDRYGFWKKEVDDCLIPFHSELINKMRERSLLAARSQVENVE